MKIKFAVLAILAAAVACGGSKADVDSGDADSLAAALADSTLRMDSIIGHDSAFGPTHTIDSLGRIVPITP